MNTQEFRHSIDELHARLVALTLTKGEEYKRRDDNQFANFERGAAALGLTREQVLMVYLSKHLDSITTFVRDHALGQVHSYAEPITGRIDDAILYLLLLRGMTVETLSEHAVAVDIGQVVISAAVDTVEAMARLAELQEQATKTAAQLQLPLPGAISDTARRVFLSANRTDAEKWAKRLGYPAGLSVLSAVDQLRGLPAGTVVSVVERDDIVARVMVAEVREYCQRHGYVVDILQPVEVAFAGE